MTATTPPVYRAFTAEELETLFSIFDTFLPSISVSELLQCAPSAAYAGDKAVAAFAEDSPSRNELFRKVVTEVIPANIPPAKLAELKGVLQILRYVHPNGLLQWQWEIRQ